MGLTDSPSSLVTSDSRFPKPPGRLGDPNMSVATDPRASWAMLEALKGLGAGSLAPEPSIGPDCTREELLEKTRQDHLNFVTLTEHSDLRLPGDDEAQLEQETKIIKGGDGQDMKLYITRPKEASDNLPGIIYIHGGGMTTILTDNKIVDMWARDLAGGGPSGAVTIAVDFRNAYDEVKHDLRPFPAGLNDCAAGAEWVAAHKAELGIAGKLLITGESGGGNLAIATALKLKRDGKANVLDGVYAVCPFISGAYGWPRERLLKELPSLVECDGYLLSRMSMAITVSGYSDDADARQNPLAWPYHATEDDLKGSVPHTILVDELDPLRDEGAAFARKLVRAGVRTVSRVALGVIHAAPQIFRAALPDMRFADVEDIHGFIRRL